MIVSVSGVREGVLQELLLNFLKNIVKSVSFLVVFERFCFKNLRLNCSAFISEVKNQ